MIKGILFDMDGVLFDSERPCVTMERTIVQEQGFEMPDALFGQLPGRSTEETRALLVQTYGAAFDYDSFRSQLLQRMDAFYAENGLIKLPGVDETLALLQRQGYAMAVASSSSAQSVNGRLEESGLAGYFSHAISVDHAGGKSKPEPDIFLAAAAALGLAPGQCAAIEDSYNGLKSSAAAGCVTIMIPDLLPPTDEARQLSDTILDSLYTLPGYLEEYNARHPD